MNRLELRERITAAEEQQKIDRARIEAAEQEIGKLAELVGRVGLEMQHREAQIEGYWRSARRLDEESVTFLVIHQPRPQRSGRFACAVCPFSDGCYGGHCHARPDILLIDYTTRLMPSGG